MHPTAEGDHTEWRVTCTTAGRPRTLSTTDAATALLWVDVLRDDPDTTDVHWQARTTHVGQWSDCPDMTRASNPTATEGHHGQ